MAFVIRSMSATDLRPGQQSTPYHVFLKPVGKRAGAWWSAMDGDAQVFATLEEAEAEWLRHWPANEIGRQDIAPVNHPVPVWVALHHRPEAGR